jgi:hypothetical protein
MSIHPALSTPGIKRWGIDRLEFLLSYFGNTGFIYRSDHQFKWSKIIVVSLIISRYSLHSASKRRMRGFFEN